MRMNNKDKWIVFKKKWIDNQKNNKDTNIGVNNKNNKDKKKKGNANRDRDNKVDARKNKEFKMNRLEQAEQNKSSEQMKLKI